MAVSAYPAEWQWSVKIPQMISGETDGHPLCEIRTCRGGRKQACPYLSPARSQIPGEGDGGGVAVWHSGFRADSRAGGTRVLYCQKISLNAGCVSGANVKTEKSKEKMYHGIYN